MNTNEVVEVRELFGVITQQMKTLRDFIDQKYPEWNGNVFHFSITKIVELEVENKLLRQLLKER